ncbi:MAG: hypothetical protein AUK44_05020 [Porphyromonadaceae bacterium CG2_30_38_12]|nr:MAG: hypothetical protein AUK44_05020 [Porphyromonadaceae bacterium CG2_30_38_12]
MAWAFDLSYQVFDLVQTRHLKLIDNAVAHHKYKREKIKTGIFRLFYQPHHILHTKLFKFRHIPTMPSWYLLLQIAA